MIGRRLLRCARLPPVATVRLLPNTAYASPFSTGLAAAAAAAASRVDALRAEEQKAQAAAAEAAVAAAAAEAATAATRHTMGFVPIHHPEHGITGKILGAKNAETLLELFDKEQERFGWYTAVRVVVAIAKRRFPFDKSDDRLHRLLELLATAVEHDSMGSRARLGRPTDDVSSAVESLEKLKLKETTRAFSVLQGESHLFHDLFVLVLYWFCAKRDESDI